MVKIEVNKNKSLPQEKSTDFSSSAFEYFKIPGRKLSDLNHYLATIKIEQKKMNELKKALLIFIVLVLLASYMTITKTKPAEATSNQASSNTNLPVSAESLNLPMIPHSPKIIKDQPNPTCISDLSIVMRFYRTFHKRNMNDQEILDSIKGFNHENNLNTQINKQLKLEKFDYLMQSSDDEFTKDIFSLILDRQPKTSGLDHWVNKLNTGTDRTVAAIEILKSEEAKTRVPQTTSKFCKFTNKHGGGKNISPGIVYQKNGIEHIVFVDLSKVKRTLATDQSTGFQRTVSFAKNNDLDVAINGNWFRQNKDLDGFVVSNGKTYGGSTNPDTGQSKDHDYTALFGFTKDHKVITSWHGETKNTPNKKVYNAISGHPTLTHKGVLASEYGFALGNESQDKYTLVNPNARSAIGVSKDKKVLIITAIQGKHGQGYNAMQLAKLMQKLGAQESVMLDGGGSTALIINKKEVTRSYDNRKVLANIGLATGGWLEN